MINFIWAESKNGVIGNGNNELPWHIPAEMKHFKETTINHAIVMGRKTFASMNNRPLPKRMNYVLTRNPQDYQEQDNLKFITDIKPLVDQYQNSDEELYVIGGRSAFELFLPYVGRLIKTTIKKDYQGDVEMVKINYNEYSKYQEIDNDEFIIEYFMKKGIKNNG